ncbi:unnamed protein product [Symbiodinium sp. KB8]|nr:unnamed protein product [Symbiodinium sp. KB8]
MIEDLEEQSARLRLLLAEEALLEGCRCAGAHTADEVENVRGLLEDMMDYLTTNKRALRQEQLLRCLRVAAMAQEEIDYERLLEELEGDLEVVHTVSVELVRAALSTGFWIALTIAADRQWTGVTSDITVASLLATWPKELARTIILKPSKADPDLWLAYDSENNRSDPTAGAGCTYQHRPAEEWLHEGELQDDTVPVAFMASQATQSLKLVMGVDATNSVDPSVILRSYSDTSIMEILQASVCDSSGYGGRAVNAVVVMESVVSILDEILGCRANRNLRVDISSALSMIQSGRRTRHLKAVQALSTKGAYMILYGCAGFGLDGIEKAKKLRKLRDAVKALSEEEEVVLVEPPVYVESQ